MTNKASRLSQEPKKTRFHPLPEVLKIFMGWWICKAFLGPQFAALVWNYAQTC